MSSRANQNHPPGKLLSMINKKKYFCLHHACCVSLPCLHSPPTRTRQLSFSSWLCCRRRSSRTQDAVAAWPPDGVRARADARGQWLVNRQRRDNNSSAWTTFSWPSRTRMRRSENFLCVQKKTKKPGNPRPRKEGSNPRRLAALDEAGATDRDRDYDRARQTKPRRAAMLSHPKRPRPERPQKHVLGGTCVPGAGAAHAQPTSRPWPSAAAGFAGLAWLAGMRLNSQPPPFAGGASCIGQRPNAA